MLDRGYSKSLVRQFNCSSLASHGTIACMFGLQNKKERRIIVKILYVISTLENSGPVHVLLGLCSELSITNNVTILTLSPENENSRMADFEKLSLSIESLNLSRIEFPIKGQKKFQKFLAKHQFNIVHGHGIRADKLIADSRQKHTVSTAHNVPEVDYVFTYGRFVGKIMAIQQQKYWNNISMVVGCSNAVERAINHKNAITIFNGTINSDSSDIKKNESPVNIVFLGGITARKNIVFVLKAVSELSVPLKNVQITIVGDGLMLKKLQNEYSQLPSVQFLGALQNPMDILQQAQWLISASKSEGLPMAALEAMSKNCNLLLSDIEQHKEIFRLINDRNLCQLFSISDFSELQGILQKIDNSELIWTDGNQNVWKNNFSASVMAHNYLRLYKEYMTQI